MRCTIRTGRDITFSSPDNHFSIYSILFYSWKMKWSFEVKIEIWRAEFIQWIRNDLNNFQKQMNLYTDIYCTAVTDNETIRLCQFTIQFQFHPSPIFYHITSTENITIMITFGRTYSMNSYLWNKRRHHYYLLAVILTIRQSWNRIHHMTMTFTRSKRNEWKK